MPSPISDQARYFMPLRVPFFDESLIRRLRAFAAGVIADGSHFEHRYTHFDHLRLADPVPALPELTEFTKACVYPAISVMLLLPPNITMPVHRDGENTSYRQSVITIPLLPVQGYPGTDWFSDINGTHIVATAAYDDMKPMLLNVDEYHGNIKTGDAWRCCLQVPLAIPYELAYEHISRNGLFNGYDCTFDDIV